MKRRTVVWGGVATLVIGLLTVLGLTNPALSQYQEKILVPVAQERHSSSDALLASILQSLPMSTPSLSSSSSIEDPSGLVTVLVNRTKRDNYWLLSVYSTEFDYCQGNGASRSVGKAVGIAGRFYVIDSGMCAPEDTNS